LQQFRDAVDQAGVGLLANPATVSHGSS